MGISILINYPVFAQKAAARSGIQRPNAHGKLGPAASEEPRDTIDHFSKGLYHEYRNNAGNAIREFELCLSTDFENDKAHLHLGILLMNKGDLDGAICELGLAAIMDRNNEKARYYLGVCYLKEGLWQDAADEFKKALLIDPSYKEAKLQLSKAEDWLESEKYSDVFREITKIREMMKIIDGCPKNLDTDNKINNP